MATTIKIPAPLRVYTADQTEVTVEGSTVKTALNSLLTTYPDLRQHLFNGEELRNFVNIFVGDEDIRYRDGLDTPIEAGEKLRIIPTIAGGTN